MSLNLHNEFIIPSPEESLDYLGWPIQLFVKREDLIHPIIKGNKFRKLKYNLSFCRDNNHEGFISFGGPFSNHIHALAGLANMVGLPSVGIIRGEVVCNTVLDFCKSMGMKLHFVSREVYKNKSHDAVIKDIIELYPNFMIVPEGGSNELALIGIEELVTELRQEYDYIIVAAGTGATAAGIIKGLAKCQKNRTKVIIFSALKGDWMQQTIQDFLTVEEAIIDWQVTDEFALGGYAKVNPEYLVFLEEQKNHLGFFVDHIYNGKLLLGLKTWVESGKIKPNAKVLWVNTGGVIQ
jgi:1-aminocyclopropane-1-carboxylate deaminase